ncbi:hypothetical protein A2U01_0050918 [Trifolium medium]|uniref:Uncharacterized protein n=1 Tax=Trifolium medium TaxID=97028 RepID=A0A392R0E3_9FABA|nr:hypothetical protein [Trifolium medium]
MPRWCQMNIVQRLSNRWADRLINIQLIHADGINNILSPMNCIVLLDWKTLIHTRANIPAGAANLYILFLYQINFFVGRA